MVSQAKMLMKGENWVRGAKVEDDWVGQINSRRANVDTIFLRQNSGAKFLVLDIIEI